MTRTVAGAKGRGGKGGGGKGGGAKGGGGKGGGGKGRGGFGGFFGGGRRIATAGEYRVIMTVDGEDFAQTLRLEGDPNQSPGRAIGDDDGDDDD